MKKTVFLLLCILLLCAGTACALALETDQTGDFKYRLLEDGSAELIAYKGNAEHVIIPNALDGHPIMAVRENPFSSSNIINRCTVAVAQDHPYLATIDGVLFGKSDRKLICYPASLPAKKYQIPHGIKTIGYGAFYSCSSLTSVTIPDSVTSIGGGVFADCTSLTSITIPTSVTSIGEDAFKSCSRSLVVTVDPGSYAEQYCVKNKLKYVNTTYIDPTINYSDAPTDWLNP